MVCPYVSFLHSDMHPQNILLTGSKWNDDKVRLEDLHSWERLHVTLFPLLVPERPRAALISIPRQRISTKESVHWSLQPLPWPAPLDSIIFPTIGYGVMNRKMWPSHVSIPGGSIEKMRGGYIKSQELSRVIVGTANARCCNECTDTPPPQGTMGQGARERDAGNREAAVG